MTTPAWLLAAQQLHDENPAIQRDLAWTESLHDGIVEDSEEDETKRSDGPLPLRK